MLARYYDYYNPRNRRVERRIENDSPPEVESHRALVKREKNKMKNSAAGEINLACEKAVKSLAHSSFDEKIKTIKSWSSKNEKFLKDQIVILHQLITMEFIKKDHIAKNETITSCVQVLGLLFLANLHKIDNRKDTSRGWIMQAIDKSNLHLLSVLIRKGMLATQPKIPFSKFIHEELSEKIDIVEEYCNVVEPDESQVFSFISYPFILTTQKKMEAYQLDRRIMLQIEEIGGESDPAPLELLVERGNLIERISETFREVEDLNENHFAKNIKVEFIGEIGIDEGGLTIDFIQSAVQEMVEKKLKDSFVLVNDVRWFDALGTVDLGMLKMLGILMGMALNNGVTVDLRFPKVFYKKLFGMSATSEDLAQLLPDMCKHFIDAKEKEIKCLELTFVVNYLRGIEYEYLLKPDGDTIKVTHQTKDEYLRLYSNFLLNTSIKEMFEALKTGFLMAVPRGYVWLTSESLEGALCGSDEIDLEELENSATYGGFERTSGTVRHLWEIVHQFTKEQKILFLKFFSARQRVPIEGLSSLNMKIQKYGSDSALPRATTCNCTLLIPDYDNKITLEQKLIFVINEPTGFYYS